MDYGKIGSEDEASKVLFRDLVIFNHPLRSGEICPSR